MQTQGWTGRAGSAALASRVAAAAVVLIVELLCLSKLSASTPGQLTLDRIFSSPPLAGTAPSALAWAPDGRRLAFLWRAAGDERREIWTVRAAGDDLRRVPPPPAAAGVLSNFVWSDNGEHLFSLRGPELWATALVPSEHRRLAKLQGEASALALSPDGTRLTWLQDGDLWIHELSTRVTRPLTELALAPLSALPVGRYSRREREIGPGIWSGPTYAWSADGRHIALHLVDRRHMRKVPFPNYLADGETDPNLVRRGYPGDPNEARSVLLLALDSGELTTLALGEPTTHQVIDFAWSPAGQLLIDVASDTAVERRLYTVDPAEGTARERWYSARPTRIYTAFASAWGGGGGRIVFLSDREDRYGLYALAPASSSSPARLTEATYDVLGAPTVVPASNAVYFAGNGAGPQDQHVYRVTLDGGKAQQLTHAPGRHVGFPSPDGRSLATLHSADDQPTELFLSRSDGSDRVRVTHSPGEDFDAMAWGAVRYVSFPSQRDDHTLHARVLLPPDFDDTQRYPVLFGPVYSNTVRNRWAGTYGMVQHLLAQRGYVVVQVDVRGSTGYGRAFREDFLTDFAGRDLEDLESAVAYLKSLPFVDGERLGIWGSSYGGTLTVYSLLTKPGLYCAGVAAAAAVDPYFFGTDDVAIVRRPQSHPEIFARAARRHVDALQDHLLLIHGMQDHVVPFKTVAVLADELIKAGKDVDLAFLPGATHGWSREGPYARYLFAKLVAHFDRHLKAQSACSNDG